MKHFLSILLCILALHTRAQIITTIAGGTPGYGGDWGNATDAKVRTPFGIVKDHAGNLYFTENGNYIVRKVSTAGIITTFAGTATVSGYSGDGGPASLAKLTAPQGITIDDNDNIYVADGVVRKIDAAGIITTYAGNGTTTYVGDGVPATATGVSATDVCIDTGGNLLINASNRILRVDKNTNLITTVAGTGLNGYSGNNTRADTARIPYSFGIATDRENNIYITSYIYKLIIKISNAGIMTTVAGDGSAGGYSGDGGPATLAKLSYPYGIKVDSCNNIFFADNIYHRVRVVTAEGNIYTIAGTATDATMSGYTGDGGPATNAQLNKPTGVYLDENHDLLIADCYNAAIRKVALPRCDSLVFPAAVQPLQLAQSNLAIYPNPATAGTCSILLSGTPSGTPATITISTMAGATVYTQSLRVGIPATLSTQLPAGIYLVAARTEQATYYQKLIVP